MPVTGRRQATNVEIARVKREIESSVYDTTPAMFCGPLFELALLEVRQSSPQSDT